MSRWRILVVVTLLLLPVVVLAATGSYYLWTLHWGFYAWWPLAACMAAGYLLGWYWQRKRRLLHPPDFGTPSHWTERDSQAWQLVESRARAAGSLPAEKLSEVSHYLAVAQDMARELADFYHPGTDDPVSNLTIPEILAVIELASHDLALLVDRYLPGGHLLTIKDWRRARKAADWYQSVSNLYWAISALFSPVNTATRYVASQFGLTQPWQMLQQNLILWFYTAYIHRMGVYLIDLNSGRLRVGAARYRALTQARLETTIPGAPPEAGPLVPAAPEAEPDAADAVRQVTLTLFGQVKAGKSSLINALLGEQRARTDVLPATADIERYDLHSPGIPTHLVLLDTVGYGHEGPRADQVPATRDAAQQSDILLLVLHARNPARAADVKMLDDLGAWFASRPDLKRPPIIAVLTHVDLLSPSLEWSPPYDWQKPTRPKAQNIHDAAAAVREQLGELVTAVVPVCTVAGKEWGIEESLLPVILERLDEAHGVALLRCLRAEVDRDKVRKVFHQLLAVGKEVARFAWQRITTEGISSTALRYTDKESEKL
jgi:predicted GTPase